MRIKKKTGHWKIHQHHKCGVCSKPKRYKVKVLLIIHLKESKGGLDGGVT